MLQPDTYFHLTYFDYIGELFKSLIAGELKIALTHDTEMFKGNRYEV